MTNKETPGVVQQRCGNCERGLVVIYLASMAENVLEDEAPGSPEVKVTVSKTFLLAANSIKKGVHECGKVFLSSPCPHCREEEPPS